MKQQQDMQSIMSKFKISEIFPALQGEGKTLGRPTVFVRFYGCQLRCPWCDSMYANEGQEFKEYTVEQLVEKIKKYGINSVTFTGGEPLLQLNTTNGGFLYEALEDISFIEVETNGLLLPKAMMDYYSNYSICCYNISPKFYSDTNFNWKEKYLNEEMKDSIDDMYYRGNDAIFKFVLEHNEKREQCLQNIKKFINYHEIDNRDVYIMSEGQTFNEQIVRMKDDLELCLKEKWNYTPRMQILVYDQKRGV